MPALASVAMSPMTRPIVSYQPYRGLGGLDVVDGEAIAYVDGLEVERTKLSSPVGLEELLASYEAPRMFPRLIFCHTKPEYHTVTMDYSYSLPKSREVHGWVTLEGTRHRWVAKWRQLPKGSGAVSEDRPWLHSDEVGIGFEFHLPPPLANHPDPVIVRRVALAIERFIFALRDGWPVDIPFKYYFDNLFSIDSPMWAGEGPAVVTDRPSPLLKVIDPDTVWA